MGSIQRYLLRVITLWPSRVVCQEDSKISQTFSFCFFSFFLNLWISVMIIRLDFLDEKNHIHKINV